MEEYIQLMADKAHKHGQMFDWETAMYGKIYDDINLFKDFEADFLAIVYNDALASENSIGQNLEAYVDDIVIKSKTKRDMIADVADTFDNLRRINMKLNPKKCSFGVEEGKFLGRLRRYFEAHPIKVITDQPLKQILDKAEASRKLAKYSIELGAYNIVYDPRSAVKGQVLEDLINEVPVVSDSLVPRSTSYTIDKQIDCKEEWVLYTDGASSIKGSGAGLVLISPTKT
ncbi:reverse transcriptase domain-containing protein [Tanacetum coccineum]